MKQKLWRDDLVHLKLQTFYLQCKYSVSCFFCFCFCFFACPCLFSFSSKNKTNFTLREISHPNYQSKFRFNLVAQSCLTLCDPMDGSMSGLPVYHQLPKYTQTHVHWVGDAMQPSHPLSSPSPPARNLSQHWSPFQWVSFTSGGQRIGASASASVIPMNIWDWFHLGLTGWISLQSKGLSRVFSNTTVQKHQFFGAQLSL